MHGSLVGEVQATIMKDEPYLWTNVSKFKFPITNFTDIKRILLVSKGDSIF